MESFEAQANTRTVALRNKILCTAPNYEYIRSIFLLLNLTLTTVLVTNIIILQDITKLITSY